MKGICLRLHMVEFQKHEGILLYEWLLEFAKKEGLEGAYAFRSIAGYGHEGKMLEEHFFELGSNLPVQVVFVSDGEKIHQFIAKLKNENLELFYTLTEVELGTLSR